MVVGSGDFGLVHVLRLNRVHYGGGSPRKSGRVWRENDSGLCDPRDNCNSGTLVVHESCGCMSGDETVEKRWKPARQIVKEEMS